MSAPNHSSNERLFPLGLNIDELAHYVETFSPEQRLPSHHLSEYQSAKVNVLSWLERSARQYDSMWKMNQSKYPELREVTAANYEEKMKELAGKVPAFVWTPYEKAEEFAARKRALELKPSPLLNLAGGNEGHGGHAEHPYHTPHVQYLDHDPRFQQMIKDKVATWNKEHPDKKITESALYSREDGSVYINPAVLVHMPGLEEEVRSTFAEKSANDYKHYEDNEKSRIYTDKDGKAVPENDPRYKKLQADVEEKTKAAKEQYEKDIQAKTDEELAKQKEEKDSYEKTIQEKTDEEVARRKAENAEKAKTQYAFSAKKVDPDAIKEEIRQSLPVPGVQSREEVEKAVRQKHAFSDEETKKRIEREHLEKFVKEHPEKAKAYAVKDPHLQLVLKEVTEQNIRNQQQKAVAKKVAEAQRRAERDIYAPLTALELAEIAPPKIEITQMPGRNRRAVAPPIIPPDGGGMGSPPGGTLPRIPSGPQNLASNAWGVVAKARIAAPVIAFIAANIGWIVLLIIIVAILVALFGGDSSHPSTTSTQIPVSISKVAPTSVPNNQNIPYTITVSYPGAAQDIIVTDPIPDNASFVSASGKYSCDGALPAPGSTNGTCKTITWKVSDNLGSGLTGTPQPTTPPTTSATPSPSAGGTLPSLSGTFQLTLHPLTNDSWVTNIASAQVIGAATTTNPGGGTIPAGGTEAPNTSTCNGAYDITSGPHDGYNFGDPSCTLATSPRIPYSFQGHSWTVPQALVDLLKQLDPSNVGYWIGISDCEAPGFDPNNVSVAVNGDAYGLFQMGDSLNGPFQPGDGLNGPFDRGDVPWQTQVSNAVNYNKAIGGSWRYWACARIVWGLW